MCKKILTVFAFIFASILTMNAQYVQIGTGTQSTSYPTYSVYNYGWYSVIYTQSEIGDAKTITKIAFDCINGPKTNNNQKIYLKHTSSDIFGNANYEDPENNGYTLVYDGNINFDGMTEITLSTPFDYNGTDNLIVHYENYSGSSNYANFNSTTSADNNNKGGGSDISFPTGSGYLNPYPSSRVNIRLFYESSGPTSATNTMPAENATRVVLETDLTFDTDASVATYDVYFGTDETLVNNMDASVKIVDGATAIVGTNTVNFADLNSGELLSSLTDYFWKIVTIDATANSTATATMKFTTQKMYSDFPYTNDLTPSHVDMATGEIDNPDAIFCTGWAADMTKTYWTFEEGEWSSYTIGEYPDYTATHGYISPTSLDEGIEYWLTSPRFDLSAGTYQISFDWLNGTIEAGKGEKAGGDDETYFEISTDGGATWTRLETYDPATAQTEFETEILALQSSNNARFRWGYKIISAADYPKAYYIDNIEISEVFDGASISLSTDNMTFENIYINGHTTQEITISNTSALNNLVITGVNTTGTAFSCDYSGTILPGESYTATITFTPDAIGTNAGSIEFLIDGDFIGTNTVVVSGEGKANNETYFESFDAVPTGTLPENWVSLNNEDDMFHFVKVEEGITGEYNSSPNVLRIYNGSNNLSHDLIGVMPGVTNFDENVLRFYSHCASFDDVKLQVGLMEDPYDSTSFVFVQEITPTSPTQQFEISFDASNTKPYIAFKHGEEFTASIRIDDVTWINPNVNTPPNPAVVIYPEDEQTDVDIMNEVITMWSNSGGSPTGYKISLGTTANANEILDDVDLEDVTSYSLEDIFDFSTTYFWKIVPYNEFGDATNPETWEFTTMDNPTINVFPWADSFEDTVSHKFGTNDFLYPLGWSIENGGDQFISWDAIENSEIAPDNAHTGDLATNVMFSFMNPLDDWLFTPPLTLQANNQYEIGFWYKALLYEDSFEKLSVGVFTDNSSDAEIEVLFTDENVNFTEYTNILNEFTIPSDGNYYIGFHAYSDALQMALILDDVSVTDLGEIEYENNIETEITVCSNPSDGFYKVILSDFSNDTYAEITDITGKTVSKQKVNSNAFNVDIRNFTDGIYILNISNGEKVERVKLIKR